MLTELPSKTCQALADNIPGTSQQRLHGLLTAMVWDHDDLNRQRLQRMLELPSEGDGALIFDDTGFAKQGKFSVGVARQYSGTLGKVGNCQVTVNCHSAERTLAWPVASRLYLPAAWARDPARRAKAQVPHDITFQTKPQIALDLLYEARAWGVRWACVVADADYGDNPNFLDGLEKRRQRYVAAVRCDFAVSLSRHGGLIQRADDLIGTLAARSWRTVAWRHGSEGRLRGRFVAVCAWRIRSSGHRRLGWLIGEQTTEGKRKYYWSNLGADATLGRLVERARAALGGAVSPGGQGALGLGPVSRSAMAGIPSACRECDAGLQLSGLARVARSAGTSPPWTPAAGFFPLGRIDAGCRCRRCIARSSTGYAWKRPGVAVA